MVGKTCLVGLNGRLPLPFPGQAFVFQDKHHPIALSNFNMSTRTEKFQRKPHDLTEGKGEKPPAEDVEVIRFSPEEEAVSICEHILIAFSDILAVSTERI
jgi:hypothetical protein